jgi:hypothetical protein
MQKFGDIIPQLANQKSGYRFTTNFPTAASSPESVSWYMGKSLPIICTVV